MRISFLPALSHVGTRAPGQRWCDVVGSVYQHEEHFGIILSSATGESPCSWLLSLAFSQLLRVLGTSSLIQTRTLCGRPNSLDASVTFSRWSLLEPLTCALDSGPCTACSRRPGVSLLGTRLCPSASLRFLPLGFHFHLGGAHLPGAS